MKMTAEYRMQQNVLFTVLSVAMQVKGRDNK